MTLPTVAAFDFDGTLTHRDTLLPFLRYCSGSMQAIGKLLRLSPRILLNLGKRDYRQTIKENVLTAFLGGMSASQVRQLGKGFAAEEIPLLLRREALERLRWHQQQRHRCILLSATLDVYLEPWAQRIGFDDVITSRLQIVESRVTGKLVGKNCYGEEKLKRLEEVMGARDRYKLYAYGDSRGDAALLASADFPFYREFAKGDEA